jgi:type I restriction enzyme S subunit
LIKVINQACIYWDGLRLQNVKYQDESRFKSANRLKAGAVLLNATGTGTLGRSYVFEEKDGVFMADSHVAVLYTDETILLPRFLQVFFSLPTTQETIYTDCVNGSTNQIELSKEKIALVKVPVLTITQQKDFIEFVTQSDKSKFELQKALDELTAMQKKLMLNIFSEQ